MCILHNLNFVYISFVSVIDKWSDSIRLTCSCKHKTTLKVIKIHTLTHRCYTFNIQIYTFDINNFHSIFFKTESTISIRNVPILKCSEFRPIWNVWPFQRKKRYTFFETIQATFLQQKKIKCIYTFRLTTSCLSEWTH